jgi:hypothetical protein
MAEDACPACGRPFGEGLAADHTVVARRLGRWGFWLREFVILNVLFVVWRIVGRVSIFHQAGAVGRGRWLWRLERTLHLPSEASVQHTLLPHATLSKVSNEFYAWAHAPMLALTLLWLLWRHRDVYAKWRNLVVAFTGVSLLIGLLPVAPPRLVPNLGMVDLAARYHESVYQGLGHGVADQLSAMPSVHVGWAVLVAMAIVMVSTSRWRWLAVAYPVLASYVVVATGNHYWLDGVAALAVLGGVFYGLRRFMPRLVP